MGEIAESMLNGDLCEACGAFLGCEEQNDYPMYCDSDCAEMRGADEYQVCTCISEDGIE